MAKHPKDEWSGSKNWNELSTRSAKRQRAKKLGASYKSSFDDEIQQLQSVNVLFICSMNQWRSPTAEKIFAEYPFVIARSAGTNKGARRAVKNDDLNWADIVMVMETKHQQRLLAQFPGPLRYKELHVLDIPDNYRFMDEDLIVELKTAVDPILATRS